MRRRLKPMPRVHRPTKKGFQKVTTSTPITVLVVEDSRFLRAASAAMLERAGFTVLEAADGELALEIAAQQHVDVVILDLILPKVQGFEIIQRLRQDPRTAQVPVIVLTGLSNPPDFSAYAPVEFACKDSFTMDQIAPRVTEVLQRALAGKAS